jgi:PKD repeat protein
MTRHENREPRSERELRAGQLLSRIVPLALAGALVVASGCSSCEQSAPTSAPVVKEGRLPRPPEAVSTAAATPEVAPPSCAVVAGASVEEGVAPLEVEFDGEGMCTDVDGTFTWDFGDGSPPSHDQSPTHTYKSAGSYTAHVTLEDPGNKVKDSDEVPITVTAP